MPWHDDVCSGMEEYFLGRKAIAERIGAKLYAIACTDRLLSQEDLRSFNRSAEFVEYRIVGDDTPQNLQDESAQQTVFFEFQFWALRGSDARALFGVFFAALKGEDQEGNAVDNRYEGTWNGKAVKVARWVRESMTEAPDESVMMCTVTCQLRVTYANSE